MIANNGQDKQLPNELTSTFKELKVLKNLIQVSAKKQKLELGYNQSKVDLAA